MGSFSTEITYGFLKILLQPNDSSRHKSSLAGGGGPRWSPVMVGGGRGGARAWRSENGRKWRFHAQNRVLEDSLARLSEGLIT